MGKILIYILTEGKGGVEEFVLNLSRYTDNPSNQFGYLILGESTVYEDELKKLGVDYYFIPRKNKLLSNISTYRTLFKKLRSSYDLIYFNTSGLYYPIPYIFAQKYGYKIVLHSHLTNGSGIKKLFHYFNRAWINKISIAKYACSTPAGKWMFGNNKDFDIIPNAIELEKFVYNKNNRDDIRAEFGIENCFVIGNIGRLHPVKNQIFLVDVLSEVRKNNNKAKLLLVGDGEMKDKIIARAEDYGVAEHIIFTGSTNNPELYYSAMDCFVMPSFIEGFPITLIEAQANGLPCLISDSITSEINVSERIEFQSLDDSSQLWASSLLNMNLSRYDCFDTLQKNGYDLHKSTNNIVNQLKRI